MATVTADRAVTCPVPLDELDRSAKDFSEAVVLPPECYVDPAFFEFEMEAVFAHEWLCVGRADQVANPGDYFTTTVLGEPLIVVRTGLME